MGQKVNPNGIRLGITKQFNSTWYANTADFADNLYCDYQVRDFISKELKNASVSRIVIDRPAKSITVTIYTSKPKAVYGEKGANLEMIRAQVSKIAGVAASVKVMEVRTPELDAKLVADNIASHSRFNADVFKTTEHQPHAENAANSMNPFYTNMIRSSIFDMSGSGEDANI